MILSQADVGLLKELKAAGERGRTVRTADTQLVLDRLAKGGFVVARPVGLSWSDTGSHSAAMTLYWSTIFEADAGATRRMGGRNSRGHTALPDPQ